MVPSRPTPLARWAIASFLWWAAATGCSDVTPSGGWRAAVVVDSCVGILDGALCNDQNTCTTGDRCLSGVCLGTLAPNGTPCTDGNQCTSADLCNQGVCQGMPVTEGTLCTDGEPCTGPDTCRAGKCTPGPDVTCDDGMSCTVDTCVMGKGCQFQSLAICPDGGTNIDADAADVAQASDRPGDSGLADVVVVGDAPGDVDSGPRPDADAEAGADEGDSESDASVDGTEGNTKDGPIADRIGEGDGLDAMNARDADNADATPSDATPDGVGALTFKVRGGACSCAVATAPSPAAAASVVALALVLLRLSRRHRRR